MGREKNPNPTRRIHISITDKLAGLLEQLAELGIHGSTISEVAKYLVTRGVESAFKEGFLERPISLDKVQDG